MFASVARQETELLQLAAQFGIKFDQGAGDAEAGRPGLSGDSAAVGEDQDIELVRQLGSEQRLAHVSARGFVCEIMLKGPVVDRDLAFAGPQKNARRRGLAAARSQMLN